MGDLTVWITTGGGVLVAIVTGVVSWVISRTKARSDIQSTVNDGFNRLVNEMQEELARHIQEVGKLRETISVQDKNIYKLQVRLRNMAYVVTTLHNYIVDNNLKPPPYEPDKVNGSD